MIQALRRPRRDRPDSRRLFARDSVGRRDPALANRVPHDEGRASAAYDCEEGWRLSFSRIPGSSIRPFQRCATFCGFENGALAMVGCLVSGYLPSGRFPEHLRGRDHSPLPDRDGHVLQTCATLRGGPRESGGFMAPLLVSLRHRPGPYIRRPRPRW